MKITARVTFTKIANREYLIQAFFNKKDYSPKNRLRIENDKVALVQLQFENEPPQDIVKALSHCTIDYMDSSDDSSIELLALEQYRAQCLENCRKAQSVNEVTGLNEKVADEVCVNEVAGSNDEIADEVCQSEVAVSNDKTEDKVCVNEDAVLFGEIADEVCKSEVAGSNDENVDEVDESEVAVSNDNVEDEVCVNEVAGSNDEVCVNEDAVSNDESPNVVYVDESSVTNDEGLEASVALENNDIFEFLPSKEASAEEKKLDDVGTTSTTPKVYFRRGNAKPSEEDYIDNPQFEILANSVTNYADFLAKVCEWINFSDNDAVYFTKLVNQLATLDQVPYELRSKQVKSANKLIGKCDGSYAMFRKRITKILTDMHIYRTMLSLLATVLKYKNFYNHCKPANVLGDTKSDEAMEADKSSDMKTDEAVEADKSSDMKTDEAVDADKVSETKTDETVEEDKVSETKTDETVEADKVSETKTVETVEADKTSDAKVDELRKADMLAETKDDEPSYADEFPAKAEKTQPVVEERSLGAAQAVSLKADETAITSAIRYAIEGTPDVGSTEKAGYEGSELMKCKAFAKIIDSIGNDCDNAKKIRTLFSKMGLKSSSELLYRKVCFITVVALSMEKLDSIDEVMLKAGMDVSQPNNQKIKIKFSEWINDYNKSNHIKRMKCITFLRELKEIFTRK